MEIYKIFTSIVVHESATTGAVYRGNVEEIYKNNCQRAAADAAGAVKKDAQTP
jgi:hypothetical protein